MANFTSDNETPVAPAIMQALQAANEGTARAYAEDAWTRRLDDAFTALFGTPTVALPVATGTVANSIALACVAPPWGIVFCHRISHAYCDEGGCPELYGDGLRLVPVDGEAGKIQPAGLEKALKSAEGHGVHSYAPAALSLTQCTEAGTVYRPAEVGALSSLARDHGLAVHMDGARFGNAVAALGCDPAEVTCEAGVQMLSFGATKNGCMAAEALLFFDHGDLLERAERLRKRGGHLLSKMRFVSAQLLAYLEDGLWLRLATHANTCAARFAEAVDRHPEASLEYPVEANESFVRWTPEGFARLRAAEIQFQMWPDGDDLARFVFAHSTTEDDLARLVAALGP